MDERKESGGEGKMIPDALMSVGKDEMNFVEVPLSQICRRPDTGEKTFVIERRRKDKHTGELVTRTTMVTGSDAFGLLLPCDDVVMIGLVSRTIQFAQEQGELNRKVFFSRHGLCHEIGWSPNGRNYQKLEASLDRMSGVRIKTKNAWYDNGEQEWKSLNFGILDNYELCDKRKYDRSRPKGQLEFPLCYFIWNEVPFKSFRDNYVKSIDMNLFRSINRSAVALRLYRLCDKRFHFGSFQVPLRKLAGEHLGLSRKYAPSQMKREIDRGYNRLVDERYLAPMNGERYITVDSEERVVFAPYEPVAVSAGSGGGEVIVVTEDGVTVSDEDKDRIGKLFERGVENGAELLRKYGGEKVDRAILNFDDRRAHSEDIGPGWLGKCITHEIGYGFRKGYVSPEEKEKRKVVARRRRAEKKAEAERKELERKVAEDKAESELRSFIESLGGAAEQETFFEEALASAGAFERKQYTKALSSGNSENIAMYRELILRRAMEAATA